MKLLCSCLGNIEISSQMKENGQVNINCQNYDVCDGSGFILDNKIYYNKEIIESKD